LPDVLRDHPQLAAIGRITLLQSLRCVRMTLWDEKGQRLISFGEAVRRRPEPTPIASFQHAVRPGAAK
jgi:omega-6 fatty acid desaturase (delta-12 desaturase)